jgi:hypothetical protein
VFVDGVKIVKRIPRIRQKYSIKVGECTKRDHIENMRDSQLFAVNEKTRNAPNKFNNEWGMQEK